MSIDQKHNVVLQTLEQEKAQRENYRKDEEAKKSSSSSTNDDSSSESETGMPATCFHVSRSNQ